MTSVEKLNSVERLREDFPIFGRKVNGKPLVYFDNGATTLKPMSVVQVMEQHYSLEASNVHRGVHTLSAQATVAFEKVRIQVQEFLHAKSENEIIFTSGTTASVNLVALSFGERLSKGDEILITAMEHHSNIVPWQMLCEKKGCELKVVPIHQDGSLDLETFQKLISSKTKLVSCTYISNTLGTINPIKKITEWSHAVGAKVLVDAAQAVLHLPIDVQNLNCDFLAFSAHKLLGPTGVGVLYGKLDLLESMPPVFGGGDMIKAVTFKKTTYNDVPFKFEAGTPHIAGVLGLGAALEYVKKVGFVFIQEQERTLLQYLTEQMSKIPEVKIIGQAAHKSSIVSFIVKGVHASDVGTLLDQEGVAVRTGHHCTQPLMEFYQIPATARASLTFYNTKQEVDVFINALKKAIHMLCD